MHLFRGLLRRLAVISLLAAPFLGAAPLQAQTQFVRSPGGLLFLPVAPVAPAVPLAELTPLQGSPDLRPLEDLKPLSAPQALEALGVRPQAWEDGYLREVDGKSGRELLEALHEMTARGHQTRNYGAARQYMFSVADNIVSHGVRGVLEAYTQLFVPGTSGDGSQYAEHGDENGDHYVDSGGMNAEHVWPQSFFDKAAPMRSDLHHLLPTFIHPNGIRSNLPFGEVQGKDFGYSNPAGAKLGDGMFEPPNAVKGRVARAMFYFYTRYYDRVIMSGAFGSNFWNDKLEMFQRWNRDFPPDEQERARNELVRQFQGNRNPFVDDPSLADRIGVEAFRTSGRR